MRTITVFNHVSVDGYFTDANGDMSFAHNRAPDAEWDAFVTANVSSEAVLLFGRITYQMMAGFWPSPAAAASMPVVADRMNAMRKLVFSRTLAEAKWQNATLLATDLVTTAQRLKEEHGPDVVILGSGTIVEQLTRASLVDEFQIVINPVIVGKGRSLFESLEDRRQLSLVGHRAFPNGNVLLRYVLRGS
jgi:dihydrofolate reductase